MKCYGKLKTHLFRQTHNTLSHPVSIFNMNFNFLNMLQFHSYYHSFSVFIILHRHGF